MRLSLYQLYKFKAKLCSDSSSPDIYNYNLTNILNDENQTKLSLYCDNTGTDFILYNNIGSGITGHSNRKLLYGGGESVPSQGTVSTNKSSFAGKDGYATYNGDYLESSNIYNDSTGLCSSTKLLVPVNDNDNHPLINENKENVVFKCGN